MNDGQPGGLAAGSGQQRCASGSSAERLTARTLCLPWLLNMKKIGGITATKERKRQERERVQVAVRRNASRNPLARRSTRSRGLLERNWAGRTATHSGVTSTCGSLQLVDLGRTLEPSHAQSLKRPAQ